MIGTICVVSLILMILHLINRTLRCPQRSKHKMCSILDTGYLVLMA